MVLVEGKRLSNLLDSLKTLNVQDNERTLGFMCLLVINYSVYKKGKTRNCQKQEH